MTELISHMDPVGEATLAIISKADRFNRWTFDTIQPFLKGDILEVGSGIGNISKYVISNNRPITLSDYNQDYKDHLRREYSRYKNVQAVTDINLQHPSFEEEYEQYKEKFDTIFMLNVIEHLRDDLQAVQNCKFMLRPGGHLITLAPAYKFLYCRLDKELGHHRRYTVRTLSAVLLKAGFSVLHKQYFNSLGIAGWLLLGKMLGSKNLGRKEMSVFNKLVPAAKVCDKIIFQKAGLSAIVVVQKN